MTASFKTKIKDLDDAIRALEVSTNPTLRRPCNCNATRHPLLSSAPNCLNCGKIICVKEGLGPCLFCGEALIPADDVQSMIRMLREERGREKMEANNVSQRRAEVSKTPRAFSAASPGSLASLSAAEQHRDKLLSFQETSARRTRIIDEAADFETPSSGLSMWATPQERALQLKRQQKMLREQEWNAKPEYEKRRAVVSIDLVGGKVVKKMGHIERPPDSDDEEATPSVEPSSSSDTPSGSFTQNPLLGNLTRPVYPSSTESEPVALGQASLNARSMTWRRVQDDHDDNERVILDGGIYGQDDRAER